MKFSQKLSEADHRYIFRVFMRRHYPWRIHIVMTLAIVGAAIAMAVKYGVDSRQAAGAVAVAAGYMALTMFLMPKYMEFCVIRNIRKSVSFNKNVDYETDQYGIAYHCGGKGYELLWNRLQSAELTPRGLFLGFGKKNSICILRRSFHNQKDFDELLAMAGKRNIPIIQRRH